MPPVGVLIVLLAVTQYPANRERHNGDFLLELGEHMDTAVHVGLTWELVAGYPPQVPGLAGVEAHYHVGSPLVRAAAVRWANVHPYDLLNRFEVTFVGLALVLVVRAVTHALGGGDRAAALVGFLPLAADLSMVPGLFLGAGFWAFKLGDNFIEALFYANSIAPAMALVLAAITCLARWEQERRRGWLVLSAVLAAGAGFFKVFSGAQLLLALGTAWCLSRRRLDLLVVALPVAVGLVLLALSVAPPPGAEGVRVSLAWFAPTNAARAAFGLPVAKGPAYLASGLAWIALSLGLRVIGIPGAVRSLGGTRGAAGVLGALALWGWPLATFVSITADPDVDESFYFLQSSGLALWVFAAPTLAGVARRRPLVFGLALLAAFAPVGEFLLRKVPQPPEVVPAAEVRAMKALRKASCPGDVVIMQTKVAYVPLPVVLAGRRAALADYIGYWRQFTSLDALTARRQEVQTFFRAEDAETALGVARRLNARYVYVSGRRRRALEEAGVLEPLFVEGGERVYRIVGVDPAPPCPTLYSPAERDASR